MIDILAALSLVGAAAKQENAAQLFSDAEQLYTAYSELKAGKLNFEHLAATGQLKPLVQAVARVAGTANVLLDDPNQAKNIATLLALI